MLRVGVGLWEVPCSSFNGDCRKQDKRIGGMNSLYFSLIHCEYIYTKANLTFLIDFNSIRQVS